MTNSRDFSVFMAFLKNRPDKAKELAELLGVAQREECTWIGMSEAAQWLGKSVSWLKSNKEIFPSTFLCSSGRGRPVYKFKKEELKPAYEAFLKRNQTI